MAYPAANRWQPNQRLQAQRLRRGWSQEDVARQLTELARQVGERPVGVSPTMVRNWERGRHRPRPPYPRLLCLLYGTSADSLGLSTASAAMLDERGKLDVPVATSLIGSKGIERPLHVSEDTVRDLEAVTAAYRRMYHTVAAQDLISGVTQHVQTTGRFWRRSEDPELRRVLAATVSETAMLAGRMSFFDLGRPSEADPFYGLALDAGRQAEDRALQAVVLGNRSFVLRHQHDTQGALALLAEAKRLASDEPVIRSWATALEAVVQAASQEPAKSLAALEAAEVMLDDAPTDIRPTWFDYYDHPRLAGFKGMAHLRLAQPQAAHAVLEEAIAALSPEAAKQRACYLADQAAVCVDEGEVEEACRLGSQALQLLGEVEYATGVQRVRDLRLKLRPYREHPAVVDLTEQLLLVS